MILNRATRTSVLAACKIDEAVASAIAFLVEALFDPASSDRQTKLARSLFLPISRVTLVPRDRPILAHSVDVDDFLAKREKVFGKITNWTECFRTCETDEAGGVRIHTNIAITGALAKIGRTIDLMFAVRSLQKDRVIIRSTTVVYDEDDNGVSPITVFS